MSAPLCPKDPAIRRKAFDREGKPILGALEVVSAAVIDQRRRLADRAAELRLQESCLSKKKLRSEMNDFLMVHAAEVERLTSTSGAASSS